MTPRQRLLDTLAHREPDRVPINFRGGDAGVREMILGAGLNPEVRDRFLFGDIDFLTFKPRTDAGAFARYHPKTPEEADIGDWGIGTLRHGDSGESLLTMHIYHPLAGLSEPEALEDYPWPDMSEPVRSAHFKAAIDRSHAEGRPVVGQMSQTIVELSYMLCPPDRLLMDFHDNPRFVAALFDRIGEIRCCQARRFAEAGVDVLRIGDDLGVQRGLMVSPDTYRRQIKPYHAAVIQSARAANPELPVLFHSDGDVELLIPELIDIGVNAVNPVQPECVDPEMVKQRWGDRITIWGAASTQQTIAFGTEADVDAEVDRRLATLAPGGGYVLDFINTAWSPTARRNVLRYLLGIQEKGVY